MTNEEPAIKPESQVEFFLAIIEAYVEKLVQAFSQSKNKDYSQAEWQLIQNNGHVGKLLNQHVIVDSWEQMSAFLKRDVKLYGFIEEKQSGLVEIKYKFWVFFSPQVFNDFFKNQIERPKNFNMNAVITLPYIKLLEPLTVKLDKQLSDKDLGVIDKMRRILEILELSEWYLDESDFTIFDAHFKKAVASLTLSETASVLKEVQNQSATPTLLEKRLKGLFKIGWRYFRMHNELETKYFKKLLSEEPQEQEKGLKLMYKKVADFKKSL